MSKMSALSTYLAGDRKADFSKNVDNVGELASSLIELNQTLKSRNPSDFGLFKLELPALVPDICCVNCIF